MQTLLVEIESSAKAKQLGAVLSSISFVKKVSSVVPNDCIVLHLGLYVIKEINIVNRPVCQVRMVYAACNGNDRMYFIAVKPTV
jgi:hypothetical protein